MASLNQKIIEQIFFPLPSKRMQDSIVGMLNVLDSKISNNKKINEN